MSPSAISCGFRSRSDLMHATDHFGVAGEARIGQPEMGSHHAKTGHVERVKTHAVGNAG